MNRPSSRPDWPGWCAVILASGLAIGWAVALILAWSPWTPKNLTPESAQMLNGLGQVMAGAVATYLGATLATRPPRRDEVEDDHDRP